MNGAQALLRTLAGHGIDTCFMNPGTSEMHFVAALDSVPDMRAVLALFEGVATGAADGFGRMTDRPAAVLLHLGPGLGNGLANLHNARKARTPVVNIVGDHATYHKQYDSQLESDIETVARNVSTFVRRSVKTAELPSDAADAIAAALGPPGRVATLILPADVSWSDGASPYSTSRPLAQATRPGPPDEAGVAAVAAALRSGQPAGFLVGGRACRGPVLDTLGSVAVEAGAKLFCETFPARIERGAGRVQPERLAYLGEMAAAQLEGLAHLVLLEAKSPVSFFGYPEKPSDLVPEGCRVHTLACPGDDVAAAAEMLYESVGGGPAPAVAAGRPELPSGVLTPPVACAVIGHLLPDAAIVCDESNVSGFTVMGATAGAPPHDWLTLTGGSIGICLPLAVGAAVACPDRRVLALEADGSAMYTVQALWTMAREGLDVTTVIFANRSYAILNMELGRVGAEAGGPRARSMLSLARPDLDFVSLAKGLGVPATRAETAEELAEQLGRALNTPGPSLIEAVIVRA
jgi:acetolactate synthase-1/2/3 large subunit